MNLDDLLELALSASHEASKAILKEKQNPQIWQKNDRSPLTSADLASNEALCKILKKSNIPICSEEQILPFEQRKNLPYFWLIDPLDGTKGFIKGSDEYCILIALIQGQRPILALIEQPEKENLFYAHQQSKLFKNHAEFIPDESFFLQNKKKLLLSVHHPNPQSKEFMDKNDLEAIKISSALKFNALCNGEAGVYRRIESLHSWDIAAGDFLVNHGGGLMCDLSLKPILYNQESFLCPSFIAVSRKEFLTNLVG
ncbi:3'(2'),5'-bisphosphate nucleotidase CysQ [Campylobacter sp. MIT 99-7217]|uniref:3'(2'),5'-bisphosphate nucleotidase CysQ family protein n=1 Tax=Campylobacter sp. MIT 99-7217 TaxID=535091 RepID=UPI00115A152C|nr:inositol monophosphatase family protein [Campylobacter sp. MIT 99-7217]TQR33841.1 3'(2'),5'-bisphosphate nucleotidase CysQ [Campylobacter sp. MIT 99-7217]